jgi:hypothetical protein
MICNFPVDNMYVGHLCKILAQPQERRGRLLGGSSLPFSPLQRLSREFYLAIQENKDFK